MRTSHYSGVLSTSFRFTWTVVTSNAFEICRNVRYCCPRKYETWRQYPWIISDKKISELLQPLFFFWSNLWGIDLEKPHRATLTQWATFMKETILNYVELNSFGVNGSLVYQPYRGCVTLRKHIYHQVSLANDKITTSCRTNILPKHWIERYKQQQMNFEKLLG